MKVCGRCSRTLESADFTKDSRRKDGLNPYCRSCTRAAVRAYHSSNPEKAKARGAAWVAANPERQRARAKAWLDANPGKNAEFSARWREKNPGAQSLSEKRWYEANKEIVAAKDKARREANLDEFLIRERASYARRKDSVAEKNRRWREANPHRVAAIASKRRASIRRRTPSWLNETQIKQILDWFQVAQILSKQTGVPHEVDHIVPLNGKLVSGLHVPWNMCAIPAIQNRKKNNRHDVT